MSDFFDEKYNTNIRFGFVILHYFAFDATVDCVESILKTFDKDDLYEIIVVDNGSSNGTGNLLKEKYQKNSNVHVLVQDTNLGFAKGNNIGFRFAKEKLQCNFICMTNNDTLFKQKTFISDCYKIYQNYPYAVIGPKIILKDGTIQPISKGIRSRKFYVIYRNILKIQLLVSRLGIDTIKMTNFVMNLLKHNKSTVISELVDGNVQYENIKLHGCCWIFTPEFIKRFEGINDNTFLFREEELLYILLKNNMLKSLYTPELEIYHMEDVSTDMIVSTPKKKREFIYKNEIDSLSVVIDEMKEYQK